MAAALNVIALISGGKDSLFSLLHCIHNGHRVIALANLHPPKPARTNALPGDSSTAAQEQNIEESDTNSFMYQTAGHNLIPLFEAALELPLHRQPISGTAVNTAKSYYQNNDVSEHDTSAVESEEEIESMIPLLRSIMEKHPEANAVCSGAIFSDYQRTRIESVALRLGLVPLAYLWQYPKLPNSNRFQLLRDMADVGFDTRIVKVASGGLDEAMLWSNLMDAKIQARIQKAMNRFGGNILGEGGEYETVTLSGPAPIWKGRLEVKSTHMQSIAEAGGNAVLAFRPQAGSFVADTGQPGERRVLTPRNIQIWDPQFLELSSRPMPCINTSSSGTNQIGEESASPRDFPHSRSITPNSTFVGSLAYISNLTSPSLSADAKDQMLEISRQISSSLSELNRDSSSIIFTTILLHSIADNFASVNEAYNQLFHGPNPPARVTISSPLPQGVLVMVSIVFDISVEQVHEGLHVQSRSYWAPANIGPYSQAVSVPLNANVSLVHVAGQIPLVPSTMMPLHSDSVKAEDHSQMDEFKQFEEDACLSLQHMWRIGSHMKVSWWCGAIAYIAASQDAASQAETVARIWRNVHARSLWEKEESIEQFDAWDTMHGEHKTFVAQDDGLKGLPDVTCLSAQGSETTCPGIFIVEVVELPRRCPVEWQGLGLAQANIRYTEQVVGKMRTRTCTAIDTGFSMSYAAVTASLMESFGTFDVVIAAIERALQHTQSFVTVYTKWRAANASLKAQIIPCNALWTVTASGVEQLDAAIVVRSWSQQLQQT